MTTEQKIDYMIQSLQLAKEEIAYAKEYFSKREKDNNFYQYGLVIDCMKESIKNKFR